ncbi:hypothetical protein DH2020_033540 [Rehmannia glutinosa]|uniref:Myosin-2-like n=1 Tax=Rehmannia glutinosa TaxID=99300 RepID=A0ABR0VEB1_REHGL
MMSVSSNSIARSSLEEMLESLRRREENETPKDMPPALPARPKPTSRARLPSAKRSLPTSFEVDHESGPAQSSLSCYVKKGESKGQRRNSFGAKKVKEMEPGESPYVVAVAALDEKEHEQRSVEKDNAKLGNLTPAFKESEWNDNVGYFIKKNCSPATHFESVCFQKLHVWCQPHDGLWKSGQIKSTSGENALVLLSDGSVVTVPAQELLPANADILEEVDDLVQLSYLNEPSVLYNLQCRYSKDKIYSKAGPVLVAVNPFKDVQQYGTDFVTAYRQKLLDSPHVYVVADAAYNEMMSDEINQSIIIRFADVFVPSFSFCNQLLPDAFGESGAGKTETAKIAMEYLATVGRGSGGIESELLQTSCILEAFGNAKTARNDNSSRFSRVVQLAQGDRSYHIFYQLCSGAPDDLRGRLRLKRASDYKYLNQSDCLEIHNIDDAKKFHILMGALNTVRVCNEDQEHAFEMLAAVLWLGNISFLVTDKHNHIEVVPDEVSMISPLSTAVTNAASLIGCSEQDLMLALSTRKVKAGKDEVTKTLTLQQAIDTRDALAKFIYASLFDWLVEKINLSLIMGKHNTGRAISILDIYGFESFKKNSFEQFCINYANERLQQHLNRHLFKLEQEEYELDGIDQTKVDFEDNQDCLDLFEKKPVGLMSLLDEVSNFPKATGLTFTTKLKQHLNANRCFKEERCGTFSIRHCAREVIYDTGEFLEKNRDLLPFDTIQLLLSCTCQLPQYFASTLLKQSHNPESKLMQSGMLACQKQTVAKNFKGQLFELMQHLESTKPHFIHCIKPNTKRIPGVFEKDLALEQLRCSGVLEAVKIWRSGYPTRMTHQEFTRRYGILLPGNMACQDPLSRSVAILEQFNILPEMYQVGYKKLYFRAGQIGALEDVRKQVLQGTVEVQNFFCGNRARRDIHELKGVVVTLQSYVRGENARKEYSRLLRLKKQVAREKLDEQLMAVVQIQSVIRGWLARKHLNHLRKSEQSNTSKPKPGRRISEVKDLPPQMLPSVVEELQKRVLMAEATLGHKEKENAALREQVQQFDARWSEYEAKMKSMEEMWQKQIASLQISLAESKKSLGTDNTLRRPGRLDGAQSPHYYDSEDTSMGTQTPGGSTPLRFLNNGIDDVPCNEMNGGLDPVSHLVKEFEQRKQNFDHEAQAIIEVKPGHSPSVNLVEEFRRLKHRFEAWKKDYKVRLREAKAKVHRLGQTEGEKHRRKWWGKRSKIL